VKALRATAVVVLALVAGALLVSGGSDADPRTPPPLPGLPPPFLGTTVTGDGGMTAALDAYGDVVDLRPSPAGPALIDNPAARQAAGTVPADTGVVPRVRVGDGPALPLWRADTVRQGYLAGTNVVRTVARFGGMWVVETAAASAGELALRAEAGDAAGEAGGDRATRGSTGGDRATTGGGRGTGAAAGESTAEVSVTVNVEGDADCVERGDGSGRTVTCAARSGAAASRAGSGGSTADRSDSARELSGPGGAAGAGAIIRRAVAADRRWIARARPLGAAAPAWARAMYRRSLLVLHALTTRNGAVAAGARDGWAYVWPRDAATAALAYAASGYRAEARRVARFLLRLEDPVGSGSERGSTRNAATAVTAARFSGDGAPVPGRGPQGDASGWIAVAARAAGLRPPHSAPPDWRELPDYQEGAPGDYLGNAVAATAAGSRDGAAATATATSSARSRAEDDLRTAFATHRGLVRRAGDPGSGLDSAAAWAVRPFNLPTLRPAAERTLLALAQRGGRFGITPGTGWSGGVDPWTAPTAAAAWSLAALAREATAQRSAGRAGGGPSVADRDRAAALRLLADLRHAATPAGALPERVDARTGVPASTTPLAWSHAFTVLALRELWPG
jgi:glucoamylase